MNDKMNALKRCVIDVLRNERDPIGEEDLFAKCIAISSKQELEPTISLVDFRKFMLEVMKSEIRSTVSDGDENSEPLFSLRPTVQRNASAASTYSRRSKRNGSVASMKASVDNKPKFEAASDGKRNLLISLRKSTNGREMTANWSDVRQNYKKNTGRNLTTEELNRIACTHGKTKAAIFSDDFSDMFQAVDPHGQVVRLNYFSPKASPTCQSSSVSPASHSPPTMNRSHMNSSDLNQSQAIDVDLSPIPLMNSTMDDGVNISEGANGNNSSQTPQTLEKKRQEILQHLTSIGVKLPTNSCKNEPRVDLNSSIDERNVGETNEFWDDDDVPVEEIGGSMPQALSGNVGAAGDFVPNLQQNPMIIIDEPEDSILSVADTETTTENFENGYSANENEESIFEKTDSAIITVLEGDISKVNTNTITNGSDKNEDSPIATAIETAAPIVVVESQIPENPSRLDESTMKFYRSPMSNAQRVPEYATVFSKAPEPPIEEKQTSEVVADEEVARVEAELPSLSEEVAKNRRELRNLKRRLTQELENRTLQLAKENFARQLAESSEVPSPIIESSEESMANILRPTVSVADEQIEKHNITQTETRTSVVNIVSGACHEYAEFVANLRLHSQDMWRSLRSRNKGQDRPDLSILLSGPPDEKRGVDNAGQCDAPMAEDPLLTEKSCEVLQDATSTETIITVIENKVAETMDTYEKQNTIDQKVPEVADLDSLQPVPTSFPATESTSSFDSVARMVKETRDFLHEVTLAEKANLDSKNDEVFIDDGVQSLSRDAELPQMELVFDDGATLPIVTDSVKSKKTKKSKKEKKSAEDDQVALARVPRGRIFKCCAVL